MREHRTPAVRPRYRPRSLANLAAGRIGLVGLSTDNGRPARRSTNFEAVQARWKSGAGDRQVLAKRHEFLAEDARCHAEGRRVEQRVEVIAILYLSVVAALVIEHWLEFVPVGVLPG